MTRFTITLDAHDPKSLGRFWAEALGYTEEPPPAPHATWDDALDEWGVPTEKRNDAYAIVDPDGILPRVFIQRVPEPKTAKNRVHLDVVAVGLSADGQPKEMGPLRAAAERLVSHGASIDHEFDEPGQGRWIVMRDPEGNEFCVV
ncbi:MAG TPA: VOC family protein [Terrimesophilobacter sp.]|nr:VOC family protein [Terrimesophilobacter sp.]HRP99937.1 VOC family protein [Terrimesophilobacter sp.]